MAVHEIQLRSLSIQVEDPKLQAALAPLDLDGDGIVNTADVRPQVGEEHVAEANNLLQAAIVDAYIACGVIPEDRRKTLDHFFDLNERVNTFAKQTKDWKEQGISMMSFWEGPTLVFPKSYCQTTHYRVTDDVESYSRIGDEISFNTLTLAGGAEAIPNAPWAETGTRAPYLSVKPHSDVCSSFSAENPGYISGFSYDATQIPTSLQPHVEKMLKTYLESAQWLYSHNETYCVRLDNPRTSWDISGHRNLTRAGVPTIDFGKNENSVIPAKVRKCRAEEELSDFF